MVGLTRMGVRAIFSPMFRTNLVYRLMRVLLLAAAGFVLAAGGAAVHEGRIATDTQERHASMQVTSATHHARDSAASELPADLAVHVDHQRETSVPCSEGRAGGHPSGTCCTVACHAALAAPPIGLLGSSELSVSRIVALADMLEGRSNDRTERPPKRG
jgi:hypothetical protein